MLCMYGVMRHIKVAAAIGKVTELAWSGVWIVCECLVELRHQGLRQVDDLQSKSTQLVCVVSTLGRYSRTAESGGQVMM